MFKPRLLFLCGGGLGGRLAAQGLWHEAKGEGQIKPVENITRTC